MPTFTIFLASLLVMIVSIYMMFHLWQHAKCQREKDQKEADKIEMKKTDLH